MAKKAQAIPKGYHTVTPSIVRRRGGEGYRLL